MEKKLVTIHSTSPDHEWIQTFENALIQQGIDATTINSYHRCLAETGHNYNEATQLFERLNTATRHEIHLLLASERHKHYLRAIAESTVALSEQDNALLVYDKSELKDDEEIMSVDAVLDLWKKKFPDRIFSREEALTYLQSILPLRTERLAATRS